MQTNLSYLRDGFAEQRSSGSVGSATLNGTSFERPAGVYDCTLVGTYTVTASSGSVAFRLQGSNDDSNWHTITELNAENYFTTTGETKALNSDLGNVTPIGRWKYLRVQTAIISGTPTYTIAYQFAGIARNSTKYLDTATLARTASAVNGDSVVRRAGAKYGTLQVVVTNYAAGGLSGYKAVLQGSPDGGTTWIEVAGSSTITANGSYWVEQDGNSLIDLGGYATYRLRMEDVGTATSGEDYDAVLTFATDDGDWLAADPDSVGGIPEFVAETFIVAKVTAQGAEAGNAINVTFGLYKFDGTPLREQRVVEVRVYDTANAVQDGSTNGTVASASTGTVLFGGTTNRATCRTDSNGVLVVSIADASAETIYAAIANPDASLTTRQMIVESEPATLVFA